MKKQTNNQFSPLTKVETGKLTTVVNETLAQEFSQPRSFSSADLWNIQRKSRTMTMRRYHA
jgi:hypothetical protein